MTTATQCPKCDEPFTDEFPRSALDPSMCTSCYPIYGAKAHAAAKLIRIKRAARLVVNSYFASDSRDVPTELMEDLRDAL